MNKRYVSFMIYHRGDAT